MNQKPTIEHQLRQYADAVDPSKAGDTGNDTGNRVAKHRGPAIPRWFAAAAALLVLAAGAVAVLQRDPVQQIETGAFAQEPVEPHESTGPPDADAVTQGETDGETVVRATGPMLLLPDLQRWVVVEDWIARNDAEADLSSNDVDRLQLDLAPLDEAGVPQLGRRISMSYRLGPFEEFDRWWGDTSAMGEPVDFIVGDGVGRSVHNAEVGFAAVQVWNNGTFVYIQTQDAEADLTELAMSLTVVDEATWTAARAGAEDQRRVAVEAAMQKIEPVVASGEPMAHWVLPEPWQLQWVTDKTIWTPEQHAQSAAFSEANRPPSLEPATANEFRTWQYGFAETSEAAARQFVPQVSISVAMFAEAPVVLHPNNYAKVSALGLSGVMSPLGGSGMLVDLGTGELRVSVETTSSLDRDDLRAFLDSVTFISDEPLDGFVVIDPRFQPIELPLWDDRPPNWHAGWTQPNAPDARISVWRLSVPDLRVWMQTRGEGLDVPDDVWETIASGGVVDFANSTMRESTVTYDLATGMLLNLYGIEQAELIPIELDDWIALAEPVNTDPVNPR